MDAPTLAVRKKISMLALAICLLPALYYLWLRTNPTAVAGLLRPLPGGVPFQAMSLFEQISAVIGGFIYKPLHMILTMVLIYALWRVRSVDLVALRWGLFFFWLGEAFCAVNYLVFTHTSHFSEFLHSYGMVVGFAFTFYALFEGLDGRLIKFSASNKKCAAAGLCVCCIKAQPVSCGARRIILLALPAMLVLSLLPLTARLQGVLYQADILGTLYDYEWPQLYQLSEARLAPVLAFLLFLSAWIAMFADRRQPVPDTARMLAAAGFGALAFGALRFTLKTMFASNMIWADYWEELTELIFILAVAAVLIQFRQSLFQEIFPSEREISIRQVLRPGSRPFALSRRAGGQR